MLILALESSCDDTAAAVLEDGRTRSSVVSSQVDLHAAWGGVVPELASRHHALTIVPVIRSALGQAGVELRDVSAVAATYGPGLVGSLLVALQTAKGIAYARGIPFLGVNHLAGHLAAIQLAEEVPYPHVGLMVSGGHTALYLVPDPFSAQLLGDTRDDAAGEAFDKTAKLVGLGYPGGAIVDQLAEGGDPARFKLPRAMPGQRNLEFSFSGLKTAARTLVERGLVKTEQDTRDYCASVREAIVAVLVKKSLRACRMHDVLRLVLAGGVAANTALRREMVAQGKSAGVTVHVPPRALCTDNAAMVGRAALPRLLRGDRSPLSLDADPSATLTVGRAEEAAHGSGARASRWQ
jgi:N6-L-threonylcarbamoyladenine synthase